MVIVCWVLHNFHNIIIKNSKTEEGETVGGLVKMANNSTQNNMREESGEKWRLEIVHTQFYVCT